MRQRIDLVPGRLRLSLREHWHTAADGTRLYARDEGPLDRTLPPLLCLAGLTRNSGDFDPVFDRIAASRRVIGMDFRGRGKSAHAADPATYRPDVELQDTLGFLDQLGLDRVAVLGTSRGGIVGLLAGTIAPQRLAGLLLNDIGCKLEPQGLLRIMDYVGIPRLDRSWDAAAISFAAGSQGFDGVTHEQWLAVVKRIYRETSDGITHNHDLALADTLPSREDVADAKLPELWGLLPALANVPFALIRGAGSDLLSLQTVERMQREAPHLQAYEIADRGHVPFLDEPASVIAINQWLNAVDKKEKGQ